MGQDSKKINHITTAFLQSYFGYSALQAQNMLEVFFQRYPGEVVAPSQADEAVTYRTAVKIHYLIGLDGKADLMEHWLRQERYDAVPKGAVGYFRKMMAA